jgi:hypothetical protein
VPTIKSAGLLHFVSEFKVVRHRLLCGCKPKVTHIRRILEWEKPASDAIQRIDQCVASTGIVHNLHSIMATT